MNERHWQILQQQAGEVIQATLAELPPEVRSEADKVPCLFEPYCEDDPDLLGTYGDFVSGEVSPANGPIVLFLIAIEEYCFDEDIDFADEVRLTYLHELGHHLGWDEGELEERGLA